MIDPYDVLGIDRTADSEAVRRRYLELVRAHPPEREPERFAQVREAYDRLRDPVESLKNRLFDVTHSHSLESLVADLRPDVRRRRVPTDILMMLGQL